MIVLSSTILVDMHMHSEAVFLQDAYALQQDHTA